MKPLFLIAAFCAAFLFFPGNSFAQTSTGSAVNDLVSINIQTGQGEGTNLSTTLQILLLMTVLSMAPAILLMMTSFVRILIVFSFLRSALTLQQPPSQVLIAMALFLTAFIMAPTWQEINTKALQPMRTGEITTEAAINNAIAPLKVFMLKQMKDEDLELFTSLSSEPLDVNTPQDLPLHIIMPSFMLAELKAGFQMGLLIMLPFLVIDLVVASILMSMGMMMLPPPVVSLPIKIMVFVLIDGWALLVRSTVTSFVP